MKNLLEKTIAVESELRIVQIVQESDRGIYLSEDVFTEEKIIVKLTSKQKMNYVKLPIESSVYAVITEDSDDILQSIYILSWHDPFNIYESKTPLQKQKEILDAKFIKQFGKEKFQNLYVFGQ